jgi:hypothetical protein
MTVQTLLSPSGDKLVVIPFEEYEDLIDARHYDATLRSLNADTGESLNTAQMASYLAAPSPLAFWRAHRAMSPEALAAVAAVPVEDISRIEAGGVEGDVRHYERLAKALRVRIDDLIPT